MGMKSKLGIEVKKPLITIANLGTTIRRVTDMLLPISRESMSKDMFVLNCLPYQAMKTYRTITTEADCRRAQTIVEVQRSLNRV
jgi:hypothetical protein